MWSTSKKFQHVPSLGFSILADTIPEPKNYLENTWKKLYSLRCCTCKNYYHCLLSLKQNGQPCHSPFNRHKTQENSPNPTKSYTKNTIINKLINKLPSWKFMKLIPEIKSSQSSQDRLWSLAAQLHHGSPELGPTDGLGRGLHGRAEGHEGPHAGGQLLRACHALVKGVGQKLGCNWCNSRKNRIWWKSKRNRTCLQIFPLISFVVVDLGS